MAKFLPAGELVRAPLDIKNPEGAVVVPAGTSGVVETRDELVPEIYWVRFKGAADAIAVREGEVERIPEDAAGWVAEAVSSLAQADCVRCFGPLVSGERSVCRGCVDGSGLDAEVEKDLGDGR